MSEPVSTCVKMSEPESMPHLDRAFVHIRAVLVAAVLTKQSAVVTHDHEHC